MGEILKDSPGYILSALIENGNTGGGIKTGDINNMLLVYADDLVIVSNTLEGLQASLDMIIATDGN